MIHEFEANYFWVKKKIFIHSLRLGLTTRNEVNSLSKSDDNRELNKLFKNLFNQS